MVRKKRVFAHALLGLLLGSICLGFVGLARCYDYIPILDYYKIKDPPVIVFNPDTAYSANNHTIEFNVSLPDTWFYNSPPRPKEQFGTIKSVNCSIDHQQVLYNDSTGVNFWTNLDVQPDDVFVWKSIHFVTNVGALSVGKHTAQIMVAANTIWGEGPTYNMWYYDVSTSGTYIFTVNASTIALTDLSIQNKTYTTSLLPLTFSINETVSWIGFSLDNQANVTISGNSTLTDLTEGNHSLVVYANDTFGNMGKSDILNFNIVLPTSTPSPNSSPTIPEFPAWLLLPVALTMLAVAIAVRRKLASLVDR